MSLWVSPYLSVSLHVSPCLSRSLRVSLGLSVSLRVSPCLFMSLQVSLSPSLCPSPSVEYRSTRFIMPHFFSEHLPLKLQQVGCGVRWPLELHRPPGDPTGGCRAPPPPPLFVQTPVRPSQRLRQYLRLPGRGDQMNRSSTIWKESRARVPAPPSTCSGPVVAPSFHVSFPL